MDATEAATRITVALVENYSYKSEEVVGDIFKIIYKAIVEAQSENKKPKR